MRTDSSLSLFKFSPRWNAGLQERNQCSPQGHAGYCEPRRHLLGTLQKSSQGPCSAARPGCKALRSPVRSPSCLEPPCAASQPGKTSAGCAGQPRPTDNSRQQRPPEGYVHTGACPVGLHLSPAPSSMAGGERLPVDLDRDAALTSTEDSSALCAALRPWGLRVRCPHGSGEPHTAPGTALWRGRVPFFPLDTTSRSVHAGVQATLLSCTSQSLSFPICTLELTACISQEFWEA